MCAIITHIKQLEYALIKGDFKIVNFLDVIFNLHKNIYEPKRKPDNQPIYLNVNSKHPPTTIKELPKPTGKRLSELLCNKKIFEKALPPYTDALKKKVDSKRT